VERLIKRNSLNQEKNKRDKRAIVNKVKKVKMVKKDMHKIQERDKHKNLLKNLEHK
jgi:hypothetical protein